MGLSASQARFLMLTARRSDLEFRAQQISQQRLSLSSQLESIAQDYEEATSNRVMNITLYDSSAASDNCKISQNLTYSNLVSGSYAAGYLNGDCNGISANSAYRVVNADGNVVVSSLDEIPSTRKAQTPITQLPRDSHGMVVDSNGTKYLISDRFADFVASNNLDSNCTYGIVNDVCFIHSSNGENSGSWEGQQDAKWKYTEIFLSNHCQIAFNQNGKSYNVSYYSNSDKFTGNVTVVSSADAEKIKSTETQNLTKKVEGNTCTLTAPNGEVVETYVIDKNLKGGNVGPNYFQDCLSNGKYLLEKTSASSKDDAGNQIWSAISWDVATEISESYYTEDDAAAKAKYDRLQTQIQNKDKKLELELDNIETQRSAITTEVESVQKVIDDNIESTFKSFA